MSGTNVLRASGSAARPLATLGLALNGTVLVVALLVAGLLAYALFHHRESGDGLSEGGEPPALRWIAIGALLTTAILSAGFVYTLHVLDGYARVLRQPGMTVRVTGYRYWWKVEYLRPEGDVDFVTANEIHIPVGTPVHLLLPSGDVIHSFWVPALGGKTDMIPGQTNTMWLEADSAGRYRGQCAEFCGVEHANMRILVVAQPEAAFRRWEARQRLPVADTSAAAMALLGVHGCAGCHRLRGTSADGTVGPDLTHLAGRETLAAGAAPNTATALTRWLSDPDSVKPGSLMPNTGLDPADLATLVDYLRRLR